MIKIALQSNTSTIWRSAMPATRFSAEHDSLHESEINTRVDKLLSCSVELNYQEWGGEIRLA
jgi:hypothetical protein